MNSYQNKNEYEILDASRNNSTMSTHYPRYPLANNPQASMQNTNYKDWLNMCTNNNLIPIEPVDFTWQNVLVSTFAIAAAIGTLLTAPITGGTSLVAGSAIIAAILPLTFPANDTSVPDKLMDAIQDLVRREIDQYVRNRANSELLSLRAQLDSFKGLFDYWRANQGNPNATNSVSQRFTAVHNNFIGAMALFKIEGYEELLLPVYVQAARWHLFHLRDGITYADQWQLADPTHATNAGEYHYSEFKKYSAQYADHCELVIKNQLDKIKNDSNKTWKDYNQYRRIMTFAVSDIVAEFSIIDPILYKGGINREILTRKIYTDPVNFSPGDSIADDENRYTVPPSAVRKLVGATLFTSQTPADPDVEGEFIGNRNRYLRLEGGEPFDGPQIGNSTSRSIPVGIPTTESVYEVGVRGRSGAPRILGLRWGSLTDFQQFSAGGDVYNLVMNRVSLPPGDRFPINAFNFTHRLSDIILPGNKGSSFAWTHREVDPTGNYLSTNQINLIPATKFSETPSSLGILKGPGFIGGDLVEVSYTGISYKFKLRSVSSTSFRIRVRYAGSGTGPSLSGQIYFKLGNDMSPATPWLNTGFNSSNAMYNHFKVLELYGTAQNITDNNLEIIVRSASSGAERFYLERLEIIPIGIPTEYAESQKLETAKKAVTDLFTN
ncbi:hypothetical protein COL26_32435 [Bacillus thuringiensis]|uniref:Crystaline entomocidal protoxin n=2 Tax=Bacillus thuringiensis TaxID=1428 RepID=A0ABD6RV11_BACTU|nr:hypothetical protein CN495_34815 [Bacillus thuringiensis]PEU80288.1 hypothetical protein CN411_25150 [Bacillus thuringiensis]PFH99578.1 hypothetical protein COI79_32805 [Bacillus thuringiensis]PFW20907.1 hypothetical protein COL26_32435 [Bacillus thuringiensis]